MMGYDDFVLIYKFPLRASGHYATIHKKVINFPHATIKELLSNRRTFVVDEEGLRYRYSDEISLVIKVIIELEQMRSLSGALDRISMEYLVIESG